MSIDQGHERAEDRPGRPSIDEAAVMDVLRTVPDPEMPINIVDLGLVERIEIDAGRDVRVEILPTFVGCPALPMIQEDIETRLAALADIGDIDVRFVFDPPWSVDRISDAGRADLAAHGVTVPARGEPGARLQPPEGGVVTLRTSAVPCPVCGSTNTRMESPFGPTRCRMVYYCDDCRNGFEHLKRV